LEVLLQFQQLQYVLDLDLLLQLDYKILFDKVTKLFFFFYLVSILKKTKKQKNKTKTNLGVNFHPTGVPK